MRRMSRLAVGLLLAAITIGWAPSAAAQDFALQFYELTGGANPAPRNVYLCGECTLEQFLDIPLPGPNWERNVGEDTGARITLPDDVVNTPPIPDPGTPQTLDLVPEIPGPDHFLVAQVLSGGPLGFGDQGLWTIAEVRRGTIFTYNPGTVLHTLTSSTGDDFVLFQINNEPIAEFDPFVVDGLAGISVPIGWTYSSELLTEAFTVTNPSGIATVAAVEDYWVWQLAVPEPATGALLCLGLAVLARRRTGSAR